MEVGGRGRGRTSEVSPRTSFEVHFEVHFEARGLEWRFPATGVSVLSKEGHGVKTKASTYSRGHFGTYGQVYSHTSCGDHDEGRNSKWICPMWRLVVR